MANTKGTVDLIYAPFFLLSLCSPLSSYGLLVSCQVSLFVCCY